jgi:ACS family hexuronate transporter-like MFS transporter
MSDATPVTPPARGPAWKWWVCGLLLLATMLNYMDRLTLNLTSVRILRDFHLDERDYGYLESAFAFAFALGAIVFGWLADRRNIRRLYPAAVLAWSAAGFATGLAHTFLVLLLCRFLLGLAEAGNWPCALRTTQRILTPAERTMGNSLLQSGAALGAVLTPLIVLALIAEPPAWQSPDWIAGNLGITLGQGPLHGSPLGAVHPWLVPTYQAGAWRYPFLVVGALGVTWVFFWLLSVRREDLALARPAPAPSLTAVLGPLVVLLGLDTGIHLLAAREKVDPLVPLLVKVAVTVLGIAAVYLWLTRATRDDTALPRRVFFRRFWVLMTLVVAINLTWHYFRAWLPLFLQKQHGYSERFTSWFVLAYYVATDVGSLSAGFVTLALIRRGLPVHRGRLLVFAVCAGLTTLSVVAAVLPAGPLLLGVLLLIGFAALGLFPNYYSFSQELTLRHQGKMTGALSCICWLAMSLLHELAGDSIKRTGSYSLGVALAGLMPLIGLTVLILFWGRETGPEEAPGPALPIAAGADSVAPGTPEMLAGSATRAKPS